MIELRKDSDNGAALAPENRWHRCLRHDSYNTIGRFDTEYECNRVAPQNAQKP